MEKFIRIYKISGCRYRRIRIPGKSRGTRRWKINATFNASWSDHFWYHSRTRRSSLELQAPETKSISRRNRRKTMRTNFQEFFPLISPFSVQAHFCNASLRSLRAKMLVKPCQKQNTEMLRKLIINFRIFF